MCAGTPQQADNLDFHGMDLGSAPKTFSLRDLSLGLFVFIFPQLISFS